MKLVTSAFDRAFVSLGCNARDLLGTRGRTAVYLALVVFAGLASLLTYGIVGNLTAAPAA